ncbi:MAG: DUF5615 family PIN-like protein [Desulfarculus sp.]|nr:DUF5615 family PIN-like protein [Desulfarculus sp.]
MTFFFDNNFDPKFVRGLKLFRQDVMHLQDKFPAGAPDKEWLKFVGENGLLLITQDQRLLVNIAEYQAFIKYKVGAFILPQGEAINSCKIIQAIIKNWPEIKRQAQKHKPPFACWIPLRGNTFKRIPLDPPKKKKAP